jgi:hypothetical protein
MSENLVKMCRRLSRYAHAQLSATDLERIANHIERLEAELITAEQRGYANAMEAERKLHEERIEELEADLRKMALDYLAAEGQAAEAYRAQLTAEAKLEELLVVSKRAVRLSLDHADFKLYAMEPMHQAIAAAELKGEDRG